MNVPPSNVSFNSSMNETGQVYPDDEHATLIMTMLVSYIIISVVGLCGNFMVILVNWKLSLASKNVTNLYITNIAVADFLFLLCLPLVAVYLLINRWIYGLIICKVFFVINNMNWFSGAYFMGIMAIDRWIAVCLPSKALELRTLKKAVFVSIATWIVSLGLESPFYFFTTYNATEEKCSLNTDITGPAVIAAFVSGYVIPLLTTSVFYGMIIAKVLMSEKAVGKAKTSRTHRRAKLTRTVLMIITAFLICWLPFWGLQFKILIGGKPSRNFKLLYVTFQIIGYFNSMLNPIINTCVNESFRKALVAVMCGSVENLALTTDGNDVTLDSRRSSWVHNSAVRRRHSRRRHTTQQMQLVTLNPSSVSSSTRTTPIIYKYNRSRSELLDATSSGPSTPLLEKYRSGSDGNGILVHKENLNGAYYRQIQLTTRV